MATILVVEDDEDVRSLVVLQLTIDGHDVREAATVDEGMSVLAGWTPDLVLTDLNFGTETAERLVRACLDSGQAVQVMTASVTASALPADILDRVRILHKPFTMDELSRAVVTE